MADTATDLTYTSWRDDLWLQSYGISPLNVMDYFALSPFYDRACSNEAAKLHGLAPSQLAVLAPGVEFVLRDMQPPHLFVISRQYRSAPAVQETPQAYFYVLDGTVYRAPSLHAAIASRLQRCQFSMQAAFGAMQEDLHPSDAVDEARPGSALAGKRPQAARAPDARPAPAPIDFDRTSKVEAALRMVLSQHPLPVPAVPGGQPPPPPPVLGATAAPNDDGTPPEASSAPGQASAAGAR